LGQPNVGRGGVQFTLKDGTATPDFGVIASREPLNRVDTTPELVSYLSVSEFTLSKELNQVHTLLAPGSRNGGGMRAH
jgi:hypothetical protein